MFIRFGTLGTSKFDIKNLTTYAFEVCVRMFTFIYTLTETPVEKRARPSQHMHVHVFGYFFEHIDGGTYIYLKSASFVSKLLYYRQLYIVSVPENLYTQNFVGMCVCSHASVNTHNSCILTRPVIISVVYAKHGLFQNELQLSHCVSLNGMKFKQQQKSFSSVKLIVNEYNMCK